MKFAGSLPNYAAYAKNYSPFFDFIFKTYGKEYREKVEKELEEICGIVLDLLDNHLIPKV
jgi:hypothetical protein